MYRIDQLLNLVFLCKLFSFWREAWYMLFSDNTSVWIFVSLFFSTSVLWSFLSLLIWWLEICHIGSTDLMFHCTTMPRSGRPPWKLFVSYSFEVITKGLFPTCGGYNSFPPQSLWVFVKLRVLKKNIDHYQLKSDGVLISSLCFNERSPLYVRYYYKNVAII